MSRTVNSVFAACIFVMNVGICKAEGEIKNITVQIFTDRAIDYSSDLLKNLADNYINTYISRHNTLAKALNGLIEKQAVLKINTPKYNMYNSLIENARGKLFSLEGTGRVLFGKIGVVDVGIINNLASAPQLLTALNVGIDAKKFVDAINSGDAESINKTAKRTYLDGSVGLFLIGAGTAVTLPVSIFIGGVMIASDQLDSLTDDMRDKQKQWGKNKISEYENHMSNSNFNSLIRDELIAIFDDSARLNIEYSLKYVEARISNKIIEICGGYLDYINTQMQWLVRERRISDGYFKTEADRIIYDYLENQRDEFYGLASVARGECSGEECQRWRQYYLAYLNDTVAQYSENIDNRANERIISELKNGDNKDGGTSPTPDSSPCVVTSCTNNLPKNDKISSETSNDKTIPEKIPAEAPIIYNYRGFFTGKLSGSQSFVGRRMELFGGSPFQTLAAGTNGSLSPVPGVTWQWYSYFDGKRGTNPTYSGNIPITITSASKQEGTITGAPAVSGQTYNYLYFGEYAGGVTVTGDNYTLPIERGNWIIGSQTDPANMPRSGSANTTFQGGLDGVATNGEKINGRVNLYMNFASQNLSGWMHFRRADNSRWGLASFSSVSVNNGRFTGNGTFQSYLNPSNTNGQASIYGSFYGQQAQEIGGGWNIWNASDPLMGAMGIYRGKEGFNNETAATAPVQSQPTVSYSGDVAIKFPGSSLSATGISSIVSLDGSELLANGRKSITVNNATINVTVNNASRTGDNGGNYSYTAWGAWGSSDYVRDNTSQPQAERGFYVYGRPTLNDEMPKTGTASYTGDIRGVAFDGQTIGGTASFVARFGVPGSIAGSTSSIDGSLGLRLANNQPWVTLNSTNMSVQGNRFLGNSIIQDANPPQSSGQSNPSGAISGGFYGNAAQEIAGQFFVSGVSGPGGADGVFRAKR